MAFSSLPGMHSLSSIITWRRAGYRFATAFIRSSYQYRSAHGHRLRPAARSARSCTAGIPHRHRKDDCQSLPPKTPDGVERVRVQRACKRVVDQERGHQQPRVRPDLTFQPIALQRSRHSRITSRPPRTSRACLTKITTARRQSPGRTRESSSCRRDWRHAVASRSPQ